NAELEERVRRADELAAELKASRLRLTQARDVERRRLITELGNVTTDRLATLREDLASAGQALAEPEPGNGAAAGPSTGASDKRDGDDLGSGSDDDSDDDRDADDLDEDDEEPELTGAAAAQQAVVRARVRLDELLDRFRVIARGVYPAVLRDQGPYGALDELATDLPRPVRLTGNLPARLAWEVESGIYYLAASAMQQLAGQAGERALRVHLTHADARLAVEIDDPTPSTSIAELRNGLAHDAERLAALGGDLEVSEDDAGGARLRAWLPEQLEPYVDRFSSVGTRPGAP
ncbi:MAG: hypothetical protein QOC75_5112, partial [Pseudonocardiales bacterium]|nr:hypothetical protein [Pseudonocardiales bacterium]